MSHAPVGHRSAQRPQWRQTSSSLTMIRPVFSEFPMYRSCVRLIAGALRRVRSSSSSPFSVKVMQSIGQISTEAALGFEIGELVVIAELDLGPDVLQRDRDVAQRHLVA